ncbi:MAG: hypothetical protein LBG82_03980 [Clostridiales Family XIII bacterium]|jgi:hypothetical protein|nr:hypothetical protein [Clostridiales Family XIII bacterium]
MATKKKTMLLVFAIAMVAVLAVVGTLMLFTAQSDKATNTVTIGAAEISLLEAGGDKESLEIGTAYPNKPYEDVGYSYDNNDKFIGIDYGKRAPGESVTKKPSVKNTGDVPVYVYVDVNITATKDGTPVDFDNLFSTPAGQQELYNIFSEFYTNLGQGANWKGYTSPDTTTNPIGPVFSKDGVHGGFFYCGTNSTGETSNLRALDPGDTTTDVFTTIKLPNLPNDLAGVEFSVDIIAYAVQSTGNPYNDLSSGGTTTDMMQAFSEFAPSPFPG